MERYPMTQDGLEAFFMELQPYGAADLLLEADAVAKDPLSYLTLKFELDVFMVERLRSIGIAGLRTMGWCLATAILHRESFQPTGEGIRISAALLLGDGTTPAQLACSITLRDFS
ncbi:hypothetical protein [Flavobacterium sp. C4GT6]|uniref:hypothetical protein n=1 Tax=Flavobacterium sp. C4GT6 TaxID=3103818 RepID=UPI002ED3BE3C